LKKEFKCALFLLILSLLLILSGFILDSIFSIRISLSDLISLTLSFYVAVSITLIIFLKGQKKEARNQALYTLLSISIKFLLELIIALIWFLIAKKTSLSFIILFFVLYLTFSMFSIWVILNTLKNKSL